MYLTKNYPFFKYKNVYSNFKSSGRVSDYYVSNCAFQAYEVVTVSRCKENIQWTCKVDLKCSITAINKR